MSSEWAYAEMAGAQVGHRAAVKGLGRVCAALAAQPQASFSAACGSAGRQVARRCFRRSDATVPHLLAGHYAATARRCAAHPLVLVAQDTTSFDFTTHPATHALGPIGSSPQRQGLLAHSALALSPTGEPLGLLHVDFWARAPEEFGTTGQRRTRLTSEKESGKWDRGRAGVEAVLPSSQAVLLIQDREGDVFAFLAAPRRAHTYLLLRAAQARSVRWPAVDAPASAPAGAPPPSAPTRGTLFSVVAAQPVVGELTVQIPAKRGKEKREAREARLQLQVCPLELQPPRHAKAGEPRTPQTVWVVRAAELAPPLGEPAVEWVLVSTLPVGATAPAAFAATLVGYYARRWRIERLHYTLKSGCQAERLQHDTARALEQALALYYVVAWRLLWLTYRAREAPEEPFEPYFHTAEQAVLQGASRRPVRTLQSAIHAIAELAGWRGYRSAPDPGVKMLWLGMQRLQDMARGWNLARGQVPEPIQD